MLRKTEIAKNNERDKYFKAVFFRSTSTSSTNKNKLGKSVQQRLLKVLAPTQKTEHTRLFIFSSLGSLYLHLCLCQSLPSSLTYAFPFGCGCVASENTHSLIKKSHLKGYHLCKLATVNIFRQRF